MIQTHTEKQINERPDAMSEKPIGGFCGNCKWWGKFEDQEETRRPLGECTAPQPDSVVGGRNLMFIDWGKTCPCHTPKPETQP